MNERTQMELVVDRQYWSPYAMSAFVALREKGLAFTLKTIDLNVGENQAGDFVRASMTARVPMLIHDGFALTESSAIAEYLEEQFSAPDFPRIYPADIRQRARARQLQAWLRSDFLSIREERTTAVIFDSPSAKPLSPAAQSAASRLFDALECLLPARSLNLFREWCIVDSDLALMCHRLISNGDAVPKFVEDYARHQWTRPAVQAWVAAGRNQGRPEVE